MAYHERFRRCKVLCTQLLLHAFLAHLGYGCPEAPRKVSILHRRVPIWFWTLWGLVSFLQAQVRHDIQRSHVWRDPVRYINFTLFLSVGIRWRQMLSLQRRFWWHQWRKLQKRLFVAFPDFASPELAMRHMLSILLSWLASANQAFTV